MQIVSYIESSLLEKKEKKNISICPAENFTQSAKR